MVAESFASDLLRSEIRRGHGVARPDAVGTRVRGTQRGCVHSNVLDGLEHEFNGHEDEDGIASDEDAVDADGEERGAQDKVVLDGNQGLAFLLLGAGTGDNYGTNEGDQKNKGGDFEGDGPLLEEDLSYASEARTLGILDGIGPFGEEEDDGEGGEYGAGGKEGDDSLVVVQLKGGLSGAGEHEGEKKEDGDGAAVD